MSELFEITAEYTEYFIQHDTVNLTINSNNNLDEHQLDKFIKKYFTKVEATIFTNRNRKERLERLVAIETSTSRTHAHILVRPPKNMSAEMLMLKLRLTYGHLWKKKTINDFLMNAELVRTAEGSSKYNNKELLTKRFEHNNVLTNVSTFIKGSTTAYCNKACEMKLRELYEKRLGIEITDITWNKVVRKAQKQKYKYKNKLRTQRNIGNLKNNNKRRLLKQNNFAN